MRIQYGTDDLFLYPAGPDEAAVVTTNGCVRKDGRAVMGRGIALYADRTFSLAPKLAAYIRQYGNHVFNMGVYRYPKNGRYISILTFPTKHDWRNPSDPELIRRSCMEMSRVCDAAGITRVYMPMPGCSNGRLDWTTQVRPLIEPLLDDRFVIADYALKRPLGY